MSRRVDHHIIIFSDIFFLISSFDWGIKTRFGLFCVSRLAHKHTHILLLLLLLIATYHKCVPLPYITLEGPFRHKQSRPTARGQAFDLFETIPLLIFFGFRFRFSSNLEHILSTHTHGNTRNTPYRPKNKKGRALALALLEAKYTSHSTHQLFFLFFLC
ncbi:hypothetical protein GGI42DRAFT_94505 [Trichoderma sp. SZMC 28013]